MSDQLKQDNAGEGQLFKNTDEQERIYAPQQVPGALEAGAQHDAAGGEQIAGAEGDQGTAPVVAVRPDISANTPVLLPATTEETTTDDDPLP